MTACEPIREQLFLYIYGELSFDEEERVDSHLDACLGFARPTLPVDKDALGRALGPVREHVPVSAVGHHEKVRVHTPRSQLLRLGRLHRARDAR